MSISRSGTDLNTPEGLQKTITSIRESGVVPNLIVVDTLHRFLLGDENSAQDTKTMLDACALLMQEFSCSVLLVHHTGVSSEAQHRARGSSAWKGALDIEISVEKPERDTHLSVIQRKNKDSELAETKYLDLTTVELDGWLDEDGEVVTSAVLVSSEKPIEIDSKDAERKSDIMEAWESSGMEMISGKPYISKSALKQFLIEKRGISESGARKATSEDPSRMCGKLLQNGTIEIFRNGYIIVDLAMLSACLLQSGTSGTNVGQS